MRINGIAAGAALLMGLGTLQAQLTDGLIAFWPLDEVQGAKTPDIRSGYDMNLNNLTADNVVAGKWGNAFSFSNEQQTLLSRVHDPDDELPANKHESFTISMWVNVEGAGQNDLRVFSEGNTSNSDPLFNIGTHSGGADGTVDLFFRQSGWTTVDHIRSTQEAFNGTWRHLVFVQNNGARSIYVDGQLDDLVIPDKAEGDWLVNDTTIGGILRASASHWVTGLIDEVAIWNRGLSQDEINQLTGASLLNELQDPLANGLVSHWPLDEVQGAKTPDIVSGYDMDLNKLSEADLVAGQVGNAFSFSNEQQTLLSRVHDPSDDLPANKHESFTISMWVNVDGTGQNDLRVFSEGNTGNSDPLFNLGTNNGGADGSLDLFFRQTGWTTVNHILTTQQPFDGTWRHLTFVQDSGARSVYVDGQLDDLIIPDKEEGDWLVNDTTIGGILRASASHWVTGLIDEVAIWKRALSGDEIQRVIDEGVPAAAVASTELKINSFSADFSGAAAGDPITLRWDASKDATLSIDNGIGDVTDASEFGVGSIEVQLDRPAVLTLTATRDGESVSAQTRVDVVEDVSEGWSLIENFNTYNYHPDGITGNGKWKNPEGIVNIVDFGVDKTIGFTGGDDLLALPLNSKTLMEGDQGTLFFRVNFTSFDINSAVLVNVGLTERPIRFIGDFNGGDNGPYIQFNKPEGDAHIDILAPDGNGNPLEIADVSLEFGHIYNFWIDIENTSIADGDTFSVYYQEEGDSDRTLLFSDLTGDRNPAGDQALGLPTPHLNHFFLSAHGGQGTENVFFDDIYVSIGEFLDTVPVPSPPFEFVDPGTSVDVDIFLTASMSDEGFVVSWDSSVGATYIVQTAPEVTGQWTKLAEDYPTGGAVGEVTSYTDSNVGESARYYRVGVLALPSLFSEDFESGAEGWTTIDTSGVGTTWELGAPTNGPGEANSGENVYGTDLDANYELFTDISLRSPVVDLTGFEPGNNPSMIFFHYLDVEGPIDGTLFDYGEVNILNTSGELIDTVFQAGGRTGGWRRQPVFLTDEVLGQEVIIEFRLVTDDFNDPITNESQAGWFIDDITIE